MYTFLIPVVILKTLAIILFILFGGVHLGPDEAQYWTWSQKLSLGYYSKPPGIAYQIFAGTWLFGNTELGVRFGSVVIGALLPFLVYRLAKAARYEEDKAIWAGVIWALSPVGMMGSFLAITDVGLILFWILACLLFLKQGGAPLLGLCLACGALFKWPIYLFWVFAFLCEGFNKRLFSSFLISLLGLLPSLIWNIEHDFPTFRHVSATLQGGSGQKAAGNFFEFAGAQIALLSPVFFGLFLWSYKKKQAPLLFLWMSLPVMGAGAILSLFMKIQGNWAIFAFPTAVCLAALGSKPLLKIGLACSLLMLAIVPFIPLKHNTGWQKLPEILRQAGYDPDSHFLLSDKYQGAALLSFYSPKQNVAYFLNLQGARLNQFSFWPSLKEERLGQDGFFVSFEPYEKNRLFPYFDSVEYRGAFPLDSGKNAFLFKVSRYNGKEPRTSGLY